MKIAPFGKIEYKESDAEWYGLLDNISPDNKVEISFLVNDCSVGINEKIELLKGLAGDYTMIINRLNRVVYERYRGSKWERPLEEIAEMYYLAAASLYNDNKTWWLVLEPKNNVPEIFSHFVRFTMIEREITWSNI